MIDYFYSIVEHYSPNLMYGHGIKDGVVEKKEQDIKND